MEEEMLSLISNGGMNVNAEASDSNSSNSPFHASKRLRHDGNKVSLTKFKGVVPQQNGHWGAQIYANHQRIWLGTFKSEREAAMAYDSAAIKLRSRDSHRNFPWTNLNVQEPNFQNQYSTEAVLNMIKDGSYQSKFADFLKTRSQGQAEVSLKLNPMRLHEGHLCRQLFQKELTPSDVGKLNRLVIPKTYAIKHFPRISESTEENAEDSAAGDTQLVFYDRLMRSWKFRYCYWKSSQSFVFTRGWNRFVKEMDLKAKDIIIFYVCERTETAKGGRTFCMIDVGYNRRESSGSQAKVVNQDVDMLVKPQLHVGQKIEYGKDEQDSEEGTKSMGSKLTHSVENKGFKLFGVQIS